jgi:hypothetical protein
MSIKRRYSELSKIGRDRVNFVFPDAHIDDGYLYTIGEPAPRQARDSQIRTPTAAESGCTGLS